MPSTRSFRHRYRSATKRFGPLALVLALAVLGGWLSWHHLSQREREIRQTLAGEASRGLMDVVVSQHPLPAGTVLGEDMLVKRAVPADLVHPDALTPEGAPDFLGQTLLVDAEPGKPLLASFFSRPERVFAQQIEPGVRAVTLPVDEISSISGLLRAGDHVDFMYVADDADAGSGGHDKSVIPLLQDVEVRATGQITAEAFAALRRRSAEQAHDPYQQQSYTTVTVALAPQQAQLLILAQRLGSLHAVLRNPEDHQTQPRGLTTDDLARYVRAAAGRPPPAGRPAVTPRRDPVAMGVEFIVGGTGMSDAADASGSALRRMLASAAHPVPSTPAPSLAAAAAVPTATAWPSAWGRPERHRPDAPPTAPAMPSPPGSR